METRRIRKSCNFQCKSLERMRSEIFRDDVRMICWFTACIFLTSTWLEPRSQNYHLFVSLHLRLWFQLALIFGLSSLLFETRLTSNFHWRWLRRPRWRSALADNCLDVQIGICMFLHPSDILALRKVCRHQKFSLLKSVKYYWDL